MLSCNCTVGWKRRNAGAEAIGRHLEHLNGPQASRGTHLSRAGCASVGWLILRMHPALSTSMWELPPQQLGTVKRLLAEHRPQALVSTISGGDSSRIATIIPTRTAGGAASLPAGAAALSAAVCGPPSA